MFIRTHKKKTCTYYEVMRPYRNAKGIPNHECLGRWRASLTLSQAIEQAELAADYRRVEQLLNARLALAAHNIPEPEPIALDADNTAAGSPVKFHRTPAAAGHPHPIAPAPPIPVAVKPLPVAPLPAPANGASTHHLSPTESPPVAPIVRFEPPPPAPEPDPAQRQAEFNNRIRSLNSRLVISVLEHASFQRSATEIATITSHSRMQVLQVLQFLADEGLIHLDDSGVIKVPLGAMGELEQRIRNNGKPGRLWLNKYPVPRHQLSVSKR